ncbi:hydantoinase B/oxoprolinase family protein [Amycolatopsis sp. NPDC001319]|uniref:hydantoinase B/oxoprolinase family protein n=1 Tax=unclassified Amycolatopsis TaxID=2618356 RepID=UPI0036A20264
MLPERIPAAGGFKSSLRLIGTGAHDVAVSSLAFTGGGLGAGHGGDGVDAICYPTSSSSIPVEIYETTTGARIGRKELAPGTAGAGRFRGEHGQVVTLRPPRAGSGLTLAAGCHQQSHPPFGLAGGLAAQPPVHPRSPSAQPAAVGTGPLWTVRSRRCCATCGTSCSPWRRHSTCTA